MSDPETNERDRFHKIESIFAVLCDLPDDQIEQQLREQSGNDAFVMEQVRAMLDADRKDYPVIDSGMFANDLDDRTPIPESIGEYTILRILGEGGMGVVYEATQSNPSRRVALKVICERSMHAKIRQRFQSEADILAKLNHPGIATIYASGIAETVSGPVPFVSMELVIGSSLTHHCKHANLGTRARLELMRDVCQAVGYAHTLGVIHRDLKPSNILVNESGQIKILDFGIAVDMSISDRTQMTQTGQLIGTLKYMAPEQMERQSGTGMPQTDVYALGLICYEVLIGRSPLDDVDESVLGMIRVIGEKDHTMLGSLDRSYKGDIETIVSKALAREIDRRYTDAGDLAEDLDRYLTDQPINARKAGGWYQFRKFTKRNPFIVGSIGAAMLVLLVSLVVISYSLRQATSERLRAEHEQHTQQLINSFLTEDLFAAADPNKGGDADISLLEAMRVSSSHIPTRFKDAPEAQAAISSTIGDQFRLMNTFDEAILHLSSGVEISERLNLPIDIQVDRRNSLADAYMDIDDLETALSIIEKTVAMAQASDTISPGIMIDTLVQHASLIYYTRDFEGAAKLFEQAVEIGRTSAPDYPGLGDAISALAMVYTGLERYDESLTLHQEGLRRRIDTLGPEHPATLLDRDNLTILYIKLGRYQEALDISIDVLESRNRVFGPTHAKTYLTMGRIGTCLTKLERYEEAEAYLLKAYTGLVELFDPDHRYTGMIRGSLFELYTAWGKGDLAQGYAP